MAADEETPLTNSNNGEEKSTPLGEYLKLEVNLETIRLIGLMGIVLLLVTGKFVTNYAVVFPAKDGPSTIYDKIFNGAPSDFEPTETFLYKLFGFNHACSVLDFNPSKTISALVIIFHTIPMNIFIVCNYFRIVSHKDLSAFGEEEKSMQALQLFTKIASPIEFVFMTYLYMISVNSPDGEFGTEDGMNKFIAHYIPYMGWQSCMVLMAIQQSWYMYLKKDIPKQFEKLVGCKMLKGYTWFVFFVFCLYTVFVWSFIRGTPIWETAEGTFGNAMAKLLMWLWNLIALFIPALFAYLRGRDGVDFEIILKEKQ